MCPRIQTGYMLNIPNKLTLKQRESLEHPVCESDELNQGPVDSSYKANETLRIGRLNCR
jgi:hypothetical protein